MLAEARVVDDHSGIEGTAIVLQAMCKQAELDAALKRAIDVNSDWPSAIARIYAFRGDPDQAMVWLERAYSVKEEIFTSSNTIRFSKT